MTAPPALALNAPFPLAPPLDILSGRKKLADPKRKFCKWLTFVNPRFGGEGREELSSDKSFKLNFLSTKNRKTTATLPGPPLGTVWRAAPQVLVSELASQKGAPRGAGTDQGQPVCLPATVRGVVN